jgi:hypothetical protein
MNISTILVLVCSFSCTFVHGVSVGFLVGGNYPDQPESGMGAEASLLLEAKPTKSRSNRMSANDPQQTLLAAASANAALPLTQSYDKVLDCSRPA